MNVRASLGFMPRKHQSGEVDWSGRISKCGDGIMRSLLFEAKNTLIA
ncbi:transposase [Saliniramus fredricksonii]|nr:transposase [Saliniramus fredricksonii]